MPWGPPKAVSFVGSKRGAVGLRAQERSSTAPASWRTPNASRDRRRPAESRQRMECGGLPLLRDTGRGGTWPAKAGSWYAVRKPATLCFHHTSELPLQGAATGVANRTLRLCLARWRLLCIHPRAAWHGPRESRRVQLGAGVEPGPPRTNQVRPRSNRSCGWLEAEGRLPGLPGTLACPSVMAFRSSPSSGAYAGVGVPADLATLSACSGYAGVFGPIDVPRAWRQVQWVEPAGSERPEGTLAGHWPAIDSRPAKAGGARGKPMDREVRAGHAVK